MADGRPIHGKNAYIYISGIALVGANSWDLIIKKDTVETDDFGDEWKQNIGGIKSGSGNISGWQFQDKSTLIDAVTADGPVGTYIYPDRNDATNYFSGDFVFNSFNGSASTSAAVAGGAAWVSDGTLTVTGFS